MKFFSLISRVVPLWLVLASCVVLAGCLPSSVSESGPTQVIHGGSVSTGPSVPPSKSLSPAAAAAQGAANTVAKWFYIAAVALLLAAGGFFYVGQVVPGIKCLVAGVTLPILGVWFAWHYAWIVSGVLVVSAVSFAIARRKTISSQLNLPLLTKVKL